MAAVAALVAVSGAGSAGNPQPAPGVPPGLTKCTHAPGAWCGTVLVPLDRSGRVAGTTAVRFEYYPRTDTSRAQLGTIVAAEGGPGYSTTDSRDYYLDLFGPMQDRRALLLVDQRGTGLSEPFLCAAAQVYDGNWIANAGACGAQLGQRSDLYTSAAAAHDLKTVLDSIGVAQIDLYGDSYGSFFSQAFAVRYPAVLRTLVLDATYPISEPRSSLSDERHSAPRESRALLLAQPRHVPHDSRRHGRARRSRARSGSAPIPSRRRLPTVRGGRRQSPSRRARCSTCCCTRTALLAGSARRRPRWRPSSQEITVRSAAWSPRAPSIRRLRARHGVLAGFGPRAEIRSFSEGAYLAYACTDYPAIWNKQASFSTRATQYAATLGALPATTFAPWRTAEFADSDFFVYEYCLHWPAPGVPEPPFPAGGRYPNVPTLVLNGELDIRTDVYQAREVARNFPNSTYLEVPNMGHVTALYDADACAAGIVRRFVESISTGDTSCLSRISEHRLVQRFAERVADAPQAAVGSAADRSTAADRRAAWVAVETLADVVDRWYAIPGTTGSGLYGGKFTMTSTAGLPFTSRVWSLKLNQARWTTDVEVSGTASMPRAAGEASASLTIAGAGTEKGTLTVSWSTRAPQAQARITGTIGGRAIDLTRPAPSHW